MEIHTSRVSFALACWGALAAVFVVGGWRAEAVERPGSLREVIERAKEGGSILGPETVSIVAIERGLLSLGSTAAPEALEILQADQESPEVLAGLLSGLVGLDDRGDPKIEQAICRLLNSHRREPESARLLSLAALESLRVSQYRCPRALHVAIELYEQSADQELRIGLVAVMESVARLAEDLEALKGLLARERNEILQGKLHRALGRIEQRIEGLDPGGDLDEVPPLK